MVKDGSHRTRAIAKSGGEIAFTSKRRAFTLVAEIQEEVHRFAVTYHRQKHKASALSSTLTDIPGVGPSRAKALLRHFKTVTAIKMLVLTSSKMCRVSPTPWRRLYTTLCIQNLDTGAYKCNNMYNSAAKPQIEKINAV